MPVVVAGTRWQRAAGWARASRARKPLRCRACRACRTWPAGARLFTLPRQHGLLIAPKRSSTKTTDSHHRFHCHPNLVKGGPKPAAPNQRWVSGITCLPTRQGTVYLSLVIDVFSRCIAGHQVHSSRHTAGCLAALDRAVHRYNEERPHLALNYFTPPTKSISKEKAPPENPSGALALFLSINSRTRHTPVRPLRAV